MLAFTNQEKIVLLTLAAVLSVGSLLNLSLKKYPHLHDIVNFMDTERVYPKIDINTASLEELISVPYIGAYTAEQIIKYREEKGPFTSLEEIKTIKGIKEKNFKKFSPYLKSTSVQESPSQ